MMDKEEKVKAIITKLKLMWKTTKQMVKGFDEEPENYSEDDNSLVRSGMRFWEFLGLANPKLEKPKIIIPFTYVNCNGSQQFMLWNGSTSLDKTLKVAESHAIWTQTTPSLKEFLLNNSRPPLMLSLIATMP